jgi:hypothetical protein
VVNKARGRGVLTLENRDPRHRSGRRVDEIAELLGAAQRLAAGVACL